MSEQVQMSGKEVTEVNVPGFQAVDQLEAKIRVASELVAQFKELAGKIQAAKDELASISLVDMSGFKPAQAQTRQRKTRRNHVSGLPRGELSDRLGRFYAQTKGQPFSAQDAAKATGGELSTIRTMLSKAKAEGALAHTGVNKYITK